MALELSKAANRLRFVPDANCKRADVARQQREETRPLLGRRQAEFGADVSERIAFEYAAGIALVDGGAQSGKLRVLSTLLCFERSRAGAEKLLHGGASASRNLRLREPRN